MDVWAARRLKTLEAENARLKKLLAEPLPRGRGDECERPALANEVWSMDGEHLTRVLDAVCSLRGKPQVNRTDNGPEFTGKTMICKAWLSLVRSIIVCDRT